MFPHNHIGTIKPHEAMMYAISMLWWGNAGDNFRHSPRRGDYESRYGKPGAVIEMMPQKWREKLKGLKSEDFDKMWFDMYYDDQAWQGKQRMSEMLMEFDKRLRSYRDA